MTSTKVKVLATIIAVFLFIIFYLYCFPVMLNRNKNDSIMEYKKEIDDYSLDEQIHRFMFMQDKLYEELSE